MISSEIQYNIQAKTTEAAAAAHESGLPAEQRHLVAAADPCWRLSLLADM